VPKGPLFLRYATWGGGGGGGGGGAKGGGGGGGGGGGVSVETKYVIWGHAPAPENFENYKSGKLLNSYNK
jgi:hypothetical protein